MELLDIRKQNTILKLNSVRNGNITLDLIAKDIGLSKMTVSEITRCLVAKNILEIQTEPQQRSGRRSNLYSIIDKYHCMFFEENRRGYSCISINTKGQVIDRFDYVFRNDINKQENIKLMFKKFKKKRIFNQYCVDIFAVCEDDTAELLPKNVIRTTKEKMILTYLSENNKVILFKLGKQLAISAYSHIHFPKNHIGEVTINKVLSVDKEYFFSDELYDGVFLALEKHSMDKIYDLI